MSSSSSLLRNTATASLLVITAVAILWGPQLLPGAQAGPTVRRYCGAGLTRRISLLCQNMYNGNPVRVRRGIVENCCQNACSDQTIQSYCGDADEPQKAEDSPDAVVPDDNADLIEALLTADLMYRGVQPAPEMPATTAKAPVTQSKLEIGRLPKDYLAKGWTYTG